MDQKQKVDWTVLSLTAAAFSDWFLFGMTKEIQSETQLMCQSLSECGSETVRGRTRRLDALLSERSLEEHAQDWAKTFALGAQSTTPHESVFRSGQFRNLLHCPFFDTEIFRFLPDASLSFRTYDSHCNIFCNLPVFIHNTFQKLLIHLQIHDSRFVCVIHTVYISSDKQCFFLRPKQSILRPEPLCFRIRISQDRKSVV